MSSLYRSMLCSPIGKLLGLKAIGFYFLCKLFNILEKKMLNCSRKN